MNEALLWTDGRYFLQATQELTGEWKLMRMLEDPAVDVWMANVSCRLFYYIIIRSYSWKLRLCKRSFYSDFPALRFEIVSNIVFSFRPLIA